MSLVVQSPSKEYIRARVTATEAGSTVDPTALSASFAFVSDGSDPSSWTAGVWETDNGRHYARIIVGGTGTGATEELAEGTYRVWVKVQSGTEVPVDEVGTLVIA